MWTSELSMQNSRKRSQILQTKYMQVRSQTEQVRNSQLLYRSVSVEVTLDLVQCIYALENWAKKKRHIQDGSKIHQQRRP